MAGPSCVQKRETSVGDGEKGEGGVMVVPSEPDLSYVCKNESDRMNLRNLIYTVWAINRHGVGSGGDAVKCYLVSKGKKS